MVDLLRKISPLMNESVLMKMYQFLVEQEQNTPWYMVVVGIFLVVFAGFTFTGANVIQKHVCDGTLNVWSLFLIRGLTQMPIMATHVLFTKGNFVGPIESRRTILLQGIFGGLLLMAIFVAIQHVPLGNASAIFFTTPGTKSKSNKNWF